MRDGNVTQSRFTKWRVLEIQNSTMSICTLKPRTTRKTRVARLVYMLATGQLVRTNDLCKRYRVSRRTFARYIADIREAGFDIVYSEMEDSYRLISVDFVSREFRGP